MNMFGKKEEKPEQVYSLQNGFPYSHHPYASQYSRPDGPILLQDFHLLENIASFDRERVPERVVHAKGGGCRLEFELTDSLSDITYAAPYQEVGYKCPGLIRFSTVGGESGTPDTARDPRGVSFKFYTKWGNHDWVFNNTPVFFLRDAIKFPVFIHTQKRDPQSHLNQFEDTTIYWDYLTMNPESIHQITYMFGDRGTPASWSDMNAYSGHSYIMVNKEGKDTYVQFHVLSDTGFATLTGDKAAELSGSNPDYNQAKLFSQMQNGEKPKFTCYVQTMTPEQAVKFKYSVNDLTKIWPHKEFPLRKFGTITLTENVDNYFQEIEQVAFSPTNTCIPGIKPSNDSVLQARLFSYPDTQRHRLGANYQQLPVNRPRNLGCPYSKEDSQYSAEQCPFKAANFQRDGPMSYYNFGPEPNYISSLPNQTLKFKNEGNDELSDKFKGVTLDEVSKASLKKQEEDQIRNEHIVDAKINQYYYVYGMSPLDFEQPRALFEKVYDPEQKKLFVHNVVCHACKIKDPNVKKRVPQYFGLLNEDLGKVIAEGLEVEWEPVDLQGYAKTWSIASSN